MSVDQFSWVAVATESTIAAIDASQLAGHELLGRLGSVEPQGELTLEQALDLQGSLYDNDTFDQVAVFQLDRLPGRAGPWWVTLEPNGFRGSSETTLAKIAGEADAAAFFWNVNAVMRFLWVEGGEVRSSFDPLLEPDRAPVDSGQLDFEDRPAASALCLLARISGVTPTETWFRSAKPTFLVSAPIL